MVVVDALHGDSAAAAAADELLGIDYAGLLAFLDHTVPEVKASGCGSDDEEELEWLSNKDAFPTVETMDSAWARPRTKSRAVVACRAAERRQCRHCGSESTPQWREGPMGPRTLCNACGMKYRNGRLLPEYRPAKSPTFSAELHSNRHHRIVELRRLRGEVVQTSLAATGYGKEGGQELERLSNKSVFLGMDTMAPAAQRPRTKGLQRPRRVLAWIQPPPPPPPPRTPAQGRFPGGGDDGAAGGGGAGAGGRRAAAPAGGGVEPTAPRGLAVAKPRRSQGRRDGMAVDKQQRCVPGGGDVGVGGDAAADEGRAVGLRVNQPGPGGGELALGQGLGVPFVGRSCTARGGAAGKGPAAAAAAPSGGGVDHAARAAAAALPTPAWAGAQWWCQHCGTETTPQRREGPDGRRTLCNAGGVPFVGHSCTAGGGAAGKGPAAAAAAPSGGGVDHAAAALPTPAWAAAQWRCQHCGTETTPQLRGGPDGRRTLCNACGLRYKEGGLVPEYRPASSRPTFSDGRLHSNRHRIVQRLRASHVVTTAIAAAAAAAVEAGEDRVL